jgi:pyruvate,water dikinase
MERYHRDLIIQRYPHASGKVSVLKEYAYNQTMNVEDPAGQGEAAYRRLFRELESALTACLWRMDKDGFLAYAALGPVQARVKQLIEKKRAHFAALPVSAISLEQVDADASRLVGGKGANLGEIHPIVKTRGGFVPQAIMVTVHAFSEFLGENEMDVEFRRNAAALDHTLSNPTRSWDDKMAAVEEQATGMRRLIRTGRLREHSGTGKAILDLLSQQGLDDAPLAVRSSALQEDTEEAAFAGAAATYLYVQGPERTLDSIKEAWRSFWFTRGIVYRHLRGFRQVDVKAALTVQMMFDSEVSGVIFTTDPVSGRDVLVIEAGYGLGEGIMSGLVDTDRFYINKYTGRLVDMHIGRKSEQVVRNPSGQGTVVDPVEEYLRNRPCLDADAIRRLTDIAVLVEQHYALSQDIEFGIRRDEIAILQTRPVTTRSCVNARPGVNETLQASL